MADRIIFLLGGARSGKSTYAENWARENGGTVLFVATAQAFDDDMRERIRRHRADRPPNWRTIEAPTAAGDAIRAALAEAPAATVLVDCITLLTANALLALGDEDPTAAASDRATLAEIDALLAAAAASPGTWLLVSNEVGMGVVPPYVLGRVYRDSLGRANQRIAAAADEVLLLVAGLPWRLKG